MYSDASSWLRWPRLNGTGRTFVEKSAFFLVAREYSSPTVAESAHYWQASIETLLPPGRSEMILEEMPKCTRGTIRTTVALN